MASISPWPTVSSHNFENWPDPTNSKDITDSFDSLDSQWVESLSRQNLGESDQYDEQEWELSVQLAAKLLTIPTPEPDQGDPSSDEDIQGGLGGVDLLAEELRFLTLPEGEDLLPVKTSTPRDLEDVIDVDNSGDERENHDSGVSLERGPQHNPRFKTEWCRNFKEKGKCLYGELCQFAHGSEEMRQVGQQSNYKTRKCNKYWIAGYCPYGPRCNYLHNESPGPDQVLSKPTSQHTAYQQEMVNIRRLNQAAPTGVRRGSAGEDSTGSSGSRLSPTSSPQNQKSKIRLPSVPPPLSSLHRPTFGSGRMAAWIQNDTYIWIDTWTKTYV